MGHISHLWPPVAKASIPPTLDVQRDGSGTLDGVHDQVDPLRPAEPAQRGQIRPKTIEELDKTDADQAGARLHPLNDTVESETPRLRVDKIHHHALTLKVQKGVDVGWKLHGVQKDAITCFPLKAAGHHIEAGTGILHAGDVLRTFSMDHSGDLLLEVELPFLQLRIDVHREIRPALPKIHHPLPHEYRRGRYRGMIDVNSLGIGGKGLTEIQKFPFLLRFTDHGSLRFTRGARSVTDRFFSRWPSLFSSA